MEETALGALTDYQLEVLRSAAVWYANYHARGFAEHAGDESAYAVVQKEEYFELVAALAKLGVQVRVPDALLEEHAAAAA